MVTVPAPYTSWKAFYEAMKETFVYDEGPGPTYDGTRFTWDLLKQMVREETGQHAPYDSSETSRKFDFEEGRLEISFRQTYDSPERRLRITGYFTPGKYRTGETWVEEIYESQEAMERRFRAFDKYHAEYMMRQLLYAYSNGPDNY